MFKYLVLFLTLCSPLAFSGVSLNTTLGSLIGDVDNREAEGVMPFHASLELDLSPYTYALIGHQSTADANGNEYDGEYIGVGVRGSYDNLYAKARVVEFIRNDYGSESYYLEGGVKGSSPLRVGVFYQKGNDYEAQGVVVGYTFEVFKLWN